MVNNSMAVNYSSVAEKVFKVLKGSGLNIQMFDAQDGKELSNPEDSRFFYVSDPNLMVNLDDKNQELRVHKGPENIAVLGDLLKSLRNLAKDNLLDFDLREFGREIKPKNYTYRLNSNNVSEEIKEDMKDKEQEINTNDKLRQAIAPRLNQPIELSPATLSQKEFQPTQFRDENVAKAFELSNIAARAKDDEVSVYLARMADKYSGMDPEGWKSDEEKNADEEMIARIKNQIIDPDQDDKEKVVASEEPVNTVLPELSELEETFNTLTGTDALVEVNNPMVRDKEDYMAKKKALQDIQMRPMDDKLKAEVMRRKAELEDAAKKMGLKEGGNYFDLMMTDAEGEITDSNSDAEALERLEKLRHTDSKADADKSYANDILDDYVQKVKEKGLRNVQGEIEMNDMEPNMPEAKGTDHDKDGDIDSEDYLASRDKAIKKSMGKEVDEVSSMGMNKYGLAAKHMNGKFYSYKDGVETGVFDSMEELKAHQEKILQQMDTKHNQESIQDDELSKQLARLKELSGI
tara:strand:+ start:870 stop:2426 length:1557 start_codon:yes stop_codon:yes gene_type:complete